MAIREISRASRYAASNQQRVLSSFLTEYTLLCVKTVTGASGAHSSQSGPRWHAPPRFLLEQHKRAQIPLSEKSHPYQNPYFLWCFRCFSFLSLFRNSPIAYYCRAISGLPRFRALRSREISSPNLSNCVQS